MPLSVRIAGPLPQCVEARFPFGRAILRANRVGQRPVEGIALRDPKQSEGGVVDDVWQLIDLVSEQSVAGMQGQLKLNC